MRRFLDLEPKKNEKHPSPDSRVSAYHTCTSARPPSMTAFQPHDPLPRTDLHDYVLWIRAAQLADSLMTSPVNYDLPRHRHGMITIRVFNPITGSRTGPCRVCGFIEYPGILSCSIGARRRGRVTAIWATPSAKRHFGTALRRTDAHLYAQPPVHANHVGILHGRQTKKLGELCVRCEAGWWIPRECCRGSSS